jgi:tetratricopeptide (TPR) repeat protein
MVELIREKLTWRSRLAERNPSPDKAVDSLGKKKAAYLALKSGDLEKARDLYYELNQSYPWVAAFKFNLALTYFKQGRLQEALENLNAGLSIEPGDEKAQAMKRTIESRCKKTQPDAASSSQQIKPIVLDRNREDERMTACFLDGQQLYPRVLSLDDAADASIPGKRQPEYSASRLMNFVVFEKQRHRLENRSIHENAIDDEPHATRLTWYFSSRDMNEENKPIPNSIVFHSHPKLTAVSVNDLMTKIELLPSGEDTVFMDTMKSRYSYEISYIKEAINALHKSNQYQPTIKACEKYLEHFPDDLEILFELGNFHLERGNLGQSEATFKKILEIYYDNAYAWHNLARVYEVRGLGQFEAFCLQKARSFGYPVDEIRLARLMIKAIPVDPFMANAQWE